MVDNYKYGNNPTQEQLDAIARDIKRAGKPIAEREAEEAEQALLILDAWLSEDEELAQKIQIHTDIDTSASPKNPDNRIQKNMKAYAERKRFVRENKQKNTNSHEKPMPKRSSSTRCIRQSIRDAKDLAWDNIKGGLVSISKPSHDIPNLILHLPKTVELFAADDNGNRHQTIVKFPAWRKLHNELVKPYFYQLALSELETISNHEYRLVPFVFNESTALTEAINGQKLNRVSFLRDRLQKAFKEALQRPKDKGVAFWFSFETARRGQPHIQGAMLIRPDEARAARNAFYKFNRQMTERELHGALRFRSNKRDRLSEERSHLYIDLNWADYNLKERSQTHMEYNDMNSVVVVSQPLNKHTKDYYERFRSEFNRRGKPTKSKLKTADKLFGSWS